MLSNLAVICNHGQLQEVPQTGTKPVRCAGKCQHRRSLVMSNTDVTRLEMGGFLQKFSLNVELLHYMVYSVIKMV